MRPTHRRWIAGGALAAAIAVVVIGVSPRGSLQPAMADELVSHHLRGFAREKPCDFDSSDPQLVSRWLEDRLGYRVGVELPAGARLVGARVCSVEGARTAALMYRRDDGPLTLFVPPRGSSASLAASRLARGDVGCTKGPLGSAICATDRDSPVFAVAEADVAVLESALSGR